MKELSPLFEKKGAGGIFKARNQGKERSIPIFQEGNQKSLTCPYLLIQLERTIQKPGLRHGSCHFS
jgi:hypothetical protein